MVATTTDEQQQRAGRQGKERQYAQLGELLPRHRLPRPCKHHQSGHDLQRSHGDEGTECETQEGRTVAITGRVAPGPCGVLCPPCSGEHAGQIAETLE